MASNAAKAAHRGDGGDLRKIQSGRADASENRRFTDQTQQNPTRALQVVRLTRRCAISVAFAEALAPLAFGLTS